MSAIIKEPVLRETEFPPKLVTITDSDGIIFNEKFTVDRRLRAVLYTKIKAAQLHLPEHLYFVIYEAFRPRERQIELWQQIWRDTQRSHPQANDAELTVLCDNFVANPYHIGSGHQFGCAVDITLFDSKLNTECDMGCAMQEFGQRTITNSSLITEQQRNNRQLLGKVLAMEGVINYPSEWWHFSYGDRLWAILTQQDETLYSPLSGNQWR